MTQDSTLTIDGDLFPAAELPVVASKNPMQSVTVLAGAGFCMFSAFNLVMAVMPMSSFSAAIAAVNANPNLRHINPVQASTAMGMIGTMLTGYFAFLGVLMLAAGLGLLMKKSWGRIMAMGCALPLLVVCPPFGAAFCVFVLYVMLKRGARQNYAQLCVRA